MKVTALLAQAPALALAVSGAGCAGDDGRSGERDPDVLIFLVDTLRTDHLGLFGYEETTDAELARFAADAVVFTHAYAPSSWTKPSTATLLSGLTPRQHGAVTGADRVPEEVLLISEMLQTRGYLTAGFSANPNVLEAWGFDQGFEHFFDLGLERDLKVPVTDFHESLAAFRNQHEGDAPFFYYLHSIDPHAPYDPPERFGRRWPYKAAAVKKPAQIPANTPPLALQDTVKAYDGEIAFSDHFFGEILDDLRESGRYDDTLIVFVSDHGEEFGDHGRGGHQRTLYEEVLRVPLVVKFPGNLFAGTRVEARVALQDVTPTILETIGLELPADLAGQSLVAALRDPQAFEQRPLFFDLDREGVGREGNYVQQAVIAERYKYIRSVSPRPYELLFDIVGDPEESRDLLAQEPETADFLRALLEAESARRAEGLHLYVRNRGGDETRRFSGRLETEGRFTDLTPLQLEDTDELRLVEDGRAIEFELVVRNVENPVGSVPRVLVDGDGFRFELDPPDSRLTVQSFLADDDYPLLLGEAREPAPEAPFSLPGDAVRLLATAATLGATASSDPAVTRRGGFGHLFCVRSATDEGEVDPEILRRLHDLGYTGDGEGDEDGK